jgi:hypothetical protein
MRIFLKTILLFIALVKTPGPILAQTEGARLPTRGGSLGVSIGLSHNRFIDEGLTFSRILFRGTTWSPRIAYSNTSEKYIVNTAFAANIGSVKTKTGELPVDFLIADFHINTLRRFADFQKFGRRNRFYAGIEFRSKTYLTLNEPLLDNASLLVIHGLYSSFQQNIYLSATKELQVRMLLPIVALINREVHDGGANPATNEYNAGELLFQNGHVEFPHVMQFQLDYLKAISPKTDFCVRYNFTCLNYRKEFPMTLYANEITAGLNFYFKK